MPHVLIDGRAIEYRMIPGDTQARPTVVLLHEGLGSVGLWRDFPDKLARRLGARLLAYSRLGYGRSAPLESARTPRFMHDEALSGLPHLLDALGVTRPLLVGHSDGASIALLHAACSGRPVAGVVAMAPHVMVEPVTVARIGEVAAAYGRGELRRRLAQHHDDVDGAFLGWARIWLAPEFRDWSIVAELRDLSAPLLLIQGADDEYGTLAQLEAIAAATPVPPERLVLAGCRHAAHRDGEARVLAAIADFAGRIAADGGQGRSIVI
jgi:pimeloyl-ACP methyl ester carboxylesterase